MQTIKQKIKNFFLNLFRKAKVEEQTNEYVSQDDMLYQSLKKELDKLNFRFNGISTIFNDETGNCIFWIDTKTNSLLVSVPNLCTRRGLNIKSGVLKNLVRRYFESVQFMYFNKILILDDRYGKRYNTKPNLTLAKFNDIKQDIYRILREYNTSDVTLKWLIDLFNTSDYEKEKTSTSELNIFINKKHNVKMTYNTELKTLGLDYKSYFQTFYQKLKSDYIKSNEELMNLSVDIDVFSDNDIDPKRLTQEDFKKYLLSQEKFDIAKVEEKLLMIADTVLVKHHNLNIKTFYYVK